MGREIRFEEWKECFAALPDPQVVGRHAKRGDGSSAARDSAGRDSGKTVLRQFAGARHSQPLGNREPAALVSGRDVSRRWLPDPLRPGAAKPQYRAQDCDEPAAHESIEAHVAEETPAGMPGHCISRPSAGRPGMTSSLFFQKGLHL